ncbi:Bug family tripartite tricarboxylate transporter substrate binding protein [Roseomonas xinghualingensis]|uniref:Bug family tripartite tricarboxylate transporter substrate binding protein n=1 Tax=Roseomonas xinghualingensis TaxID=2986475 RepID=UPI0021F16F36|nr:tripartite tricarboxylate transporter substrate binding protein [Roseomonas sp. SXEYE001]MCV4205933.1 tripartite tricarboxylate transporter substrate binding protein [Roseomonas sp. SXEYE001]
MRRRHLLPLFAAPAVITRASAQGRPITLVVPYAAGGGTDIVGREFAPLFMEALGQNVVIENRGGAAGHVGAVSVSRARPDGTTLLFAVSTNIVVNPHLQRNDRVDLSTTLAPVAKASSYQYVLVIDPRVQATTLRELIVAGKAPGARFTYSSAGVGSNNHLAGLLFSEAAGVEMEHISYRGTAPALQDVVGGRVTMNFSSPPPAVPLARDGRLRAIAVTGERRLPSLPDVPTLSEAGLPGIVILGWHGIFAPAGVPEAEMDRLEAAANKAIRDPRFARSLERDGLELAAERPRAEFAREIKEEYAFWGRKARELDLKAE